METDSQYFVHFNRKPRPRLLLRARSYTTAKTIGTPCFPFVPASPDRLVHLVQYVLVRTAVFTSFEHFLYVSRLAPLVFILGFLHSDSSSAKNRSNSAVVTITEPSKKSPGNRYRSRLRYSRLTDACVNFTSGRLGKFTPIPRTIDRINSRSIEFARN